MKSRKDAFTLIELLTVIAIIAILAALALRTIGAVQEKSGRERAKAEIQAIGLALEDYKRDFGDYPVSTNTNANKILVESLAPANGKVYIAFRKNQTNSSSNIIDPFGNLYGYYYSTDTNDTNQISRAGIGFFSLWSGGMKPTNTNGWIKNW